MVERYRIRLKVLGFGGGSFRLGPLDLGKRLWFRVWDLGFVDLIQSFGSGVF